MLLEGVSNTPTRVPFSVVYVRVTAGIRQYTDQLSARELEILALVAEGFANKEAASRPHISGATVHTHLMHIYEKLHVRCLTEAAPQYLRSKPSDFQAFQ